MNDSLPQLALRQLRGQMTHPVGIALVLGIAAVLAILGPFGTLDRLGLVQRLAYWLVMVAGTYGVGTFVGTLLGHRIMPRLAALPAVLVVGIAVGLAVVPVVVAVNWIAFDWLPRGRAWLDLVGPVLVIGVVVTAILRTVETHLHPAAAPQRPAQPALLDRLPIDKRAPLVALSVEDHYVRVRTTRGEAMLLLRLADAMREVAPTPGLQVHRSHWVAQDAVRAARREGDRAILTMTHGPDIPVSRANVPALRDAGLLPK